MHFTMFAEEAMIWKPFCNAAFQVCDTQYQFFPPDSVTG